MPQVSHVAFHNDRKVAEGDLADVAGAVGALGVHALVLDLRTGRAVDLDLRGEPAAIRARYTQAAAVQPPQGRGRPRLGVTAREVTLLPSHWEWLNAQPGGASAALRRLVDQARRSGEHRTREAQDAAYRVMTALAGDRPGYEEALRAFYAGDEPRVAEMSKAWPPDVAGLVLSLVADARPRA